MSEFRYEKHYTREEAEELLPRIRAWLKDLSAYHRQVELHLEQLNRMLEEGRDVGGKKLEAHVRAVAGFYEILVELSHRCILIKDFHQGLIDFPHLREGREVFLCWKLGEEEIGYWHELNAGMAGRRPL